ncbi:MAG: SoxR reducing system RseC family protein [Betaproteobacteria bacterium]|nr:SoxR reducing system RseC family protein [Betaproteobacteria bacterium]
MSIETRVRVVSAQAGVVWVTPAESSGCGACQAQSACGISGLGKYLSRRRPDLPLAHCDAQAGDELLVRIDESDLLRAGLYAYLLPAVLGVSAAAAADAGGAGDAAAAAIAFCGVLAGLLAARLFAPTPRIQTFSPSTPRRTP